MSSTNRSNARDNHASDYYVTPPSAIFDLFKAMYDSNELTHLFLEDGTFEKRLKFLDPCAGGNLSSESKGFNPPSYPYCLNKYGVDDDNIQSIDIRDDSLAKIKSDYIASDPVLNRADIIITNPPFNVAVPIIKKAQLEVKEGGCVIMLLRLNFFGSKERKEFWEDNMPAITFVHRKRISFLKGSTDSIEYMHCVWIKGVNQNHTKLVII